MLQKRGLSVEIFHSPDGDAPSTFMSVLSAAKERTIVRITGGCADMSHHNARGMQDLFLKAFHGFKGVILIGGTRMINPAQPDEIIAGITEVGPLIRADNLESTLLGVVARTESLNWDFSNGTMTIERSLSTDQIGSSTPSHTTILMPGLDGVTILGKRITKQSIWHDEAVFCARVTDVQRHYANWNSALVVYNGGKTTEDEVRLVASEGWPVVLIKGSGRTADTFAADRDFLDKHRSVLVCDKQVTSLRRALAETGVMTPPPQSGRLRVVS